MERAAQEYPLHPIDDRRPIVEATAIRDASRGIMDYELLPFELYRSAIENGGKRHRDVMQDWTTWLSLREQGVLIQALRGPDGMTKESKAKPIVRALRGVTMVSARDAAPMGMGLVYQDDLFMQTILIGADTSGWKYVCEDFFADVDAYNIHWYQHFAQAWGCVGIGHPNDRVRGRAWEFYSECAGVFHWLPETVFEFRNRLKDGVRKLPSDK